MLIEALANIAQLIVYGVFLVIAIAVVRSAQHRFSGLIKSTIAASGFAALTCLLIAGILAIVAVLSGNERPHILWENFGVFIMLVMVLNVVVWLFRNTKESRTLNGQ